MKRRATWSRHIAAAVALLAVQGDGVRSSLAAAQTASPATPSVKAECRVESVDFKGWKGKQVSNPWVRLVVVPQIGGRLMQVTFDGHDYLFVNPQLAGKYRPPSPHEWFNYGGDKLWLLPEGNDDEQHWRGNSDVLDDGPFASRDLADGQGCGVELTGVRDPQTGIQFSRTIRLESDSPHIAFRAAMTNVSGHRVEWSMQSVTQYDTSDAADPARSNRKFWGITPTNKSSGYLNRYHVRSGPAENKAATVRDDGFFSVHYAHLAAEFWVDTTEGWLAVVDESSRYALIERFQYDEHRSYPGKASVIFWTNGPELRLSGDGVASLSDASHTASPFYMEAEINSPLCRLRPGETCALETDWFPTRADVEFHGVTDAGTVTKPLQGRRLENGKVRLSGSFGVFFPGRLVAHYYDEHGATAGTLPVADVSPTDLVVLDMETAPPGRPVRVSLHLEDREGVDRGTLQEVRIETVAIR